MMSVEHEHGCPGIPSLFHNSKSLQKETKIGHYIKKYASYFAKYLII